MVTYRNPSYLIFDKGTSFYNTSQVFTGNSFTCFVTCYNKFLMRKLNSLLRLTKKLEGNWDMPYKRKKVE